MARVARDGVPAEPGGGGGLHGELLRPGVLLLLSEEPSHGYRLLEKLGRDGLYRGPRGVLYRALRSMEREGLLVSRWSDSGLGPPRRVYEATARGREWLDARVPSLRAARVSITRLLHRYGRLAGPQRRLTA